MTTPEGTGESKYEKDDIIRRFEDICGELSGGDTFDQTTEYSSEQVHLLTRPIILGAKEYAAVRAKVIHSPGSTKPTLEAANYITVLNFMEDISNLNTSGSTSFTNEPGVELTLVMDDIHFINDYSERTDDEKQTTLDHYEEMLDQLEVLQAEGSIL